MTKILCLVVSLPQQLRFETIQSVMNQSISVELTVLLTKKSSMPTLVQRIIDAENDGLRHINLKHFDYILKLDGDTILGRDFLKNNIVEGPDAIGAGGAFLIKVSPFNEILGGKFFPDSEDPYVRTRFLMEGKKVQDYYEAPKYLGTHSSLDVPDSVALGSMYYRLGWTPIHVFHTIFWDIPRSSSQALHCPEINRVLSLPHLRIRNVFLVGSYLLACILRPQKMDTFSFIRTYQTRSQTQHIAKIFRRIFRRL